MKPLKNTDLHTQALRLKNKKRLQHDGGRAWIKDGQLHEAIAGANYGVKEGLKSPNMLSSEKK